MPEAPVVEHAELQTRTGRPSFGADRSAATTSLRTLFQVLFVRRRMVLAILGGSLLACLLYCLVAPAEYEARARVALRTVPASSLSLDGSAPRAPAEGVTAPVQTETVAGVMRSDRLAWKVILEERLYQSPAFMGRFAIRFPEFRPESPDSGAQSYLLERFQDRLHVGTVPRTLLV